MANIPIRLTCADYAKLAPLMIGDVHIRKRTLGEKANGLGLRWGDATSYTDWGILPP